MLKKAQILFFGLVLVCTDMFAINIVIEKDFYQPSLKTLNDEFVNMGIPNFKGSSDLNGLNVLIGGSSDKLEGVYFGFGYWQGNTLINTSVITASSTIDIIPIYLRFDFPVFTLKTRDNKSDILGILFEIDSVLAFSVLDLDSKSSGATGSTSWSISQNTNMQSLSFGLGAKIGVEYFIIQNTLSIKGSVGYLLDIADGQLRDDSFKYVTTSGEPVAVNIGGSKAGISICFHL